MYNLIKEILNPSKYSVNSFESSSRQIKHLIYAKIKYSLKFYSKKHIHFLIKLKLKGTIVKFYREIFTKNTSSNLIQNSLMKWRINSLIRTGSSLNSIVYNWCFKNINYQVTTNYFYNQVYWQSIILGSIIIISMYFFAIPKQIITLYSDKIFINVIILNIFKISDKYLFILLVFWNFILSLIINSFCKIHESKSKIFGQKLKKITIFIYYFRNYYLYISLIAFIINYFLQTDCTFFMFKSIYTSLLILYLYLSIYLIGYFVYILADKISFYIRFYKLNSLIYWNYVYIKKILLDFINNQPINKSKYNILNLPLLLWIFIGSTITTKIIDTAMYVLKPVYKRIEAYAETIGGWHNFFKETAGQVYEYVWAYIDYIVLIPYDYFIEPFIKLAVWVYKNPLLTWMYVFMFDTFISDISYFYHSQDYFTAFFMHYYGPLCSYINSIWSFLVLETRLFPYWLLLEGIVPKIISFIYYLGWYWPNFYGIFSEYAAAVEYHNRDIHNKVDLSSLHFFETNSNDEDNKALHYWFIRWDNVLAWCNNYRRLEITTASQLVTWFALEIVRIFAAAAYILTDLLSMFESIGNFDNRVDKKWTSIILMPSDANKNQMEYLEDIFDSRAFAILEPSLKDSPYKNLAFNKFSSDSIMLNSNSYLPNPNVFFNTVNFSTPVFKKVANMTKYEFINYIISDYNRKFWSLINKEFILICDIYNKIYDKDQINRLWNNYNYSVISNVVQNKLDKLIDFYENKYLKICEKQALPLKYQPFTIQLPIMTAESEEQGYFWFTDYYMLIDEKLDIYSSIQANNFNQSFIDSGLSDKEILESILSKYGKKNIVFLNTFFNNYNSYLSYANVDEYIPIENLRVLRQAKSFALKYVDTLNLIWRMFLAEDEYNQFLLLQKSNKLSDLQLNSILSHWSKKHDILTYFSRLKMLYNINIPSRVAPLENCYDDFKKIDSHNKVHGSILNKSGSVSPINIEKNNKDKIQKNPQQEYNDQIFTVVYTCEDNVKNKAIPNIKNIPISFTLLDPHAPGAYRLTQPYSKEKTLEVPGIYCESIAGILILSAVYVVISVFF